VGVGIPTQGGSLLPLWEDFREEGTAAKFNFGACFLFLTAMLHNKERRTSVGVYITLRKYTDKSKTGGERLNLDGPDILRWQKRPTMLGQNQLAWSLR